MKKLLKYCTIILLISMSTYACHNDEGNYEYTTDGNSFTIGNKQAINITQPIGQPLIIDPIYTINDPTLTEDMLSFEWMFKGEVISKEKILKIETPPSGTLIIVYAITDTRYGITRTNSVNVKITSNYTNGWLILSDKSGTSSLSYIRREADGNFVDLEENVYETNNEGVHMGTNPKSITYHFIQTTLGPDYYVHVNQGNNSILDLTAGTMKKFADVSDDFIGGNIPANVSVKDVAYYENASILFSEEGDVFVRNEEKLNGSSVPHVGKFTSSPVVIDNGLEISHVINTGRVANMFTGICYVLAYDKKNHRFLNFSAQYNNYGKVFTLDTYNRDIILPGSPVNDTPELKWVGPDNMSGYDMIATTNYASNFDMQGQMFVASIIRSQSNNKYYMHTFGYWYSSSVDTDLDKFYEMPIQNIDPKTIAYTSNTAANSYIFFTDDTKRNIYYMNVSTKAYKKIYTANSDITTLCTGETSNMMFDMGFGDLGVYGESLIVGTSTGEIVILSTSSSSLTSQTATVLKTYTSNVGKIVDIKFLANEMMIL